MNPFGNLSTDGLEQAGDFLGGGGIIDSGVYTGKIALAFAGKSEKGAHSLTVHVDIGNGKIYRETVYVTNREGKNFYERNGKKSPLPGFTTANDLALLSTGLDLASQDIEEKVVKLYDFDAKAEVPTKVQALTSMMGKEITLGILKNLEDKTKDDGNGNYVPTGETRETNTIDKVFRTATGATLSETVGKLTPEFKEKWEAKNKGRVNNKAKGATGTAGAPAGAGATPGGAAKSSSKSLFD